MTVYNINLGIGWASSGVEYAQAYRSKVLKSLNIPAKFIFMDMFQSENLQHFTHNIGFDDDEIIWLYTYFTDVKVAPTSFTTKQLEKTFTYEIDRIERGSKVVRYHFKNQNLYVNAAVCGEQDAFVQRVEYVQNGQLVRKDYYNYTKIFSEYYTVCDNTLKIEQRTFFNENGSVAYDEIIRGNDSIFCFSDCICQSKAELVGYMLKKMALTSDDVILLDRATGIGQSIFENKGNAKIAVVVHAEHFSVGSTNDDNILWNNYYEYQFSNADKVDAFITSTQRQKDVLNAQFEKYTAFRPKIYAIPVGSLDQLRYPERRRQYVAITGSRLASEKHIDWLVRAVILAKKEVPELTFDIYGAGGEKQKLEAIISENKAQDYIQLKGHQNLTDIYQKYDLYLTASTSEGFGLTLMEAVGSGLPLIGLDVPYGNQTFIESGKNGYLIPRQQPDDVNEMAVAFAQKIQAYYREMDRQTAQQYSYEIAKPYLYQRLAEQWQTFVKEITHDKSI